MQCEALINPAAPWDVGFQLSFLATLGLVLYAEPWTKAFESFASRFLPRPLVDRLTGPVAEYFLFTLAAQVFTLAVMAYHFGRVSLVAFLVNPVILPAQAPLMVLGGVSIILGWVSPVLGKLSALLAWPFVAFTIRAVEAFASLHIPQLNLGQVSLVLVLAYYAVLLALTFGGLAVRKTLARTAPVLPLASLIVLIWQAALTAPDGKLHLTLLVCK